MWYRKLVQIPNERRKSRYGGFKWGSMLVIKCIDMLVFEITGNYRKSQSCKEIGMGDYLSLSIYERGTQRSNILLLP